MSNQRQVYEVLPFDDERDTRGLSRAQGLAFGIPPAETPDWWDQSDRRQLRVLRAGEATIGGLLLLPFGQFVAGKRLEMAGIAGVAIAPEQRGRGGARFLMEHTLRDLRRRGFVHSMLYASTYPLYRGVGYEIAGSGTWLTVPLQDLTGLGRDASIRAATEADGPAIRELYRAHAVRWNGFLDRSEYIWRRITRRRGGEETPGYVVESAGELTGYAFAFERELSRDHHRLVFTDLLAGDERAARRLLSFAADHRSLVRDVICATRPGDPLLFLLRDRGYEQRTHEHWMVRLLDVSAALEGRGYAPGLRAQLELEVRDPLLPENDGRVRLEVSGGGGRVSSGGAGRLQLDVGALAALWTGFASAEELGLAGRLHGGAEDLAQASAVFACAAPSCPDHF